MPFRAFVCSGAADLRTPKPSPLPLNTATYGPWSPVAAGATSVSVPGNGAAAPVVPAPAPSPESYVISAHPSCDVGGPIPPSDTAH